MLVALNVSSVRDCLARQNLSVILIDNEKTELAIGDSIRIIGGHIYI